MKTNAATALAIAAVAIAFVNPLSAQEPDSDLIEKLGGQELKANPSGFKSRGLGEKKTEIETETRRMIFSTRGIRGVPGAVETFDREEKTTVEKKEAPDRNRDSAHGDLAVKAGEESYEISYKVDPTSQLSATSIKFVRGGVDLADAGSAQFLGNLAGALKNKKLSKFKYVIEGHASADGSAETNQVLSQERANAIFNFLVRDGVSADRIIPVGFGESRARFPDSSPERKLAEDRRVLLFKLED